MTRLRNSGNPALPTLPARRKVELLLLVLVFANLAYFGAREMLT